MRKFILTALASVTLLASAPAFVHAADTVPAAAPAVDAAAMDHKRTMVKRYFNAIHFEQLMDQMMKSMIPAMIDGMQKQNPALTAEQGKVVSDAVIETMADYTPKLMAESTDLYAEAFTEEELTQLVSFYESPVGQSIMAKSSAMMPRVSQMVMTDMPELQGKMMAKMCARMDCSAKAPH